MQETGEECSRKICSNCRRDLPLSEFYLIRARAESTHRHEKVCKPCKKSKVSAGRRRKLTEVVAAREVLLKEAEIRRASLVAQEAPTEKPIFREYKYPDGRILQLTKEDFDSVVETFRTLINGKRKREGKPLLMG